MAPPWHGHSSWNMRGGFILVPSMEQGKQEWLGRGTEGFGAASSSWSSEWLMICARGRTNPPLLSCLLCQEKVVLQLSPAAAALWFLSGLDCAFKVSPFTAQSTAEPAACAAELQQRVLCLLCERESLADHPC